MPKLISINKLVRRQTAGSKYSHFTGTWKELVENLVEFHFGEAEQGYKEGILVLSLPPEGFFSGVVEINEETQLNAEFKARREGEEPYLQLTAVGGEKSPAREVEAILYRHDVLGEDASTKAEWEIVSLNARSTEGPEPMTPVAMARNYYGLTGGTKADYSAEEFAEAILFWSKRAMKG